MIALLLSCLFSLAALLAFATLAHSGRLAFAAVRPLRAGLAAMERAGDSAARVTITSWRVEPGVDMDAAPRVQVRTAAMVRADVRPARRLRSPLLAAAA